MYQSQLLASAPGEFVVSGHFAAYNFFNDLFCFGMSSPKKQTYILKNISAPRAPFSFLKVKKYKKRVIRGPRTGLVDNFFQPFQDGLENSLTSRQLFSTVSVLFREFLRQAYKQTMKQVGRQFCAEFIGEAGLSSRQ